MGQILIRNLDDRVIAKLKLNAEAANTSLEQYLRELLTSKVMSDREAFLAFAKGMRDSCRPSDLDPTDLIREDRDR
jgi:plasmid stability protein